MEKVVKNSINVKFELINFIKYLRYQCVTIAIKYQKPEKANEGLNKLLKNKIVPMNKLVCLFQLVF
jgi:hypothetical protein